MVGNSKSKSQKRGKGRVVGEEKTVKGSQTQEPAISMGEQKKGGAFTTSRCKDKAWRSPVQRKGLPDTTDRREKNTQMGGEAYKG